MRILFVCHDFLPAHPSGAEIYTWQLAARLRERGHEVRVLATEKDIARPHLERVRREWDGIPVHELTNNLFYDDFRETWDWPPAVAFFGEVLDEFEPDVVHVMHLLYLSVGLVEEAARRKIPVFYTLHDFWLQCPRFGQRVHADGEICHTIDFARCGTCLARFKYAQTPLERRAAGVIAGLKGATGLDLSGAARALAARRGAGGGAEPDAAAERAMADAATERDRALRERLVPRVERFLAPSRFLRERFLEWGIPPERIEHLDYGLERGPFEGFRRTPSERVRVAFLGTLAPHKAPHLVLEAWRALPEDLRARGQLEVFGPKQHNPAYVARLEGLARAAGARLPGGVPRADVPALFRRIDLLVVPSVWYENQPLSILEALASRTPLVVSELGGMAELVTPEVHGWRFAPGDASDLARVLARVLADPGLLTSLPHSAPPKDMATSAAELEERYRAALARAEERAT